MNICKKQLRGIVDRFFSGGKTFELDLDLNLNFHILVDRGLTHFPQNILEYRWGKLKLFGVSGVGNQYDVGFVANEKLLNQTLMSHINHVMREILPDYELYKIDIKIVEYGVETNDGNRFREHYYTIHETPDTELQQKVEHIKFLAEI